MCSNVGSDQEQSMHRWAPEEANRGEAWRVGGAEEEPARDRSDGGEDARVSGVLINFYLG